MGAAVEAEKQSEVNMGLLPLEGLLLPLGSVDGYRCLQLGPGTSIYSFPTTS